MIRPFLLTALFLVMNLGLAPAQTPPAAPTPTPSMTGSAAPGASPAEDSGTASTSSSGADIEKGPPPSPKLKLEAGMKCTAKVTFPKWQNYKGSYNPGPLLAERTTLFTGKDLSRTNKYNTGRTETQYVRSGFFLADNSESGIQIQPVGQDGAGDGFGEHFPELAWVPTGTYDGIVKINGTKFHLFEGKDAQGNVRKAYFSLESLFPAFLISPVEQYVYAYDNSVPKNQMFTLPKELAARWELVKKRTKIYLHQTIE